MVTTRLKRRFYLYVTLLIPYSTHAAQPMQEFVGIHAPLAQTISVPVKSVSSETLATLDENPVCSKTIVSDRELAQREENAKPWILKYWQPILGGVLGAIIGYQMGSYYGSSNHKWKTPTIIGGLALGALLGPGFALGAYGLGALSEHYWPTKLPLQIGLSLVGGILGKMAWGALFPANPPKKMLEEPAPGEFLAEQRFYLETTCYPSQRFIYQQSTYQVSYEFNGTTKTVLTDYDPGALLIVNASGEPLVAAAGPP